MKYYITATLVGLMYSAASAQQSPPVDNAPPPALTGSVTSHANFTFGSDADVMADKNQINHWVCSPAEEGLIFIWEKARLSSPPFSPLVGCQEDPHLVKAVAVDPDYDAPIRYNQNGIQKSAAIYVPVDQRSQTSTSPQTSPKTDKIQAAPGAAEGRATFRKTFLNQDKQPIRIEVTVNFAVSDQTLNLGLSAQPPYIKVGLGSLEWLQSSRFVSSSTAIYTSATEQNLQAEILPVPKIIRDQDLPWIPEISRNENMLIITSKQNEFFGKISVNLANNTGDNLIETPATIFILDANYRLIGTAMYSAPIPSER
jgi:hypothetical protein